MRSGKGVHGKFGDQRASRRQHLLRDPGVFLGINNVHTGAEDGHRLSLGVDGAAMRGRVHAASQAAEDDQAAGGQIACQPFRHSESVGSGMASAHHRDSGLGNRVHIAPHIKNQRRIVDLFELRRIGGIVQADDRNSGCGDASHFVMCQFHRLAGAERLRRDGLNAGGFEFGQRGLENVAAHRRNARPTAALSWDRGAGSGQEPATANARLSLDFGVTAKASGTAPPPHRLTRGLYTSAKNDVKVSMTHSSVKIEHRPHETPSYFRDFLP